jgi:hypothetical protein
LIWILVFLSDPPPIEKSNLTQKLDVSVDFVAWNQIDANFTLAAPVRLARTRMTRRLSRAHFPRVLTAVKGEVFSL